MMNRIISISKPRLFLKPRAQPSVWSRSMVQVTHSSAKCGSSGDDIRSKETAIANLQNEAKMHYRNGDFSKVIEVSKECQDLVIDLFGSAHPVHASCLNNIAIGHKALGEYSEATEAYEKALEVYKDIIGNESPSYATSLNNLGQVYKDMYQTESNSELKQKHILKAKECFEEVLKIRSNALGNDHPDTARSLSLLGLVTYEETGSIDSAEDMLRDGLKRLRSSFGKSHLSIVPAINDLAYVYKRCGRYNESIALYKEALSIQLSFFPKQSNGSMHHTEVLIKQNLAEALRGRGDEATAMALQTEILNALEAENN